MVQKQVSLGVLFAVTLVFTPSGDSAGKTDKSAAHHAGNVVLLPERMQEDKLLKKKAKKIVQEAVEAVAATQQALMALEQGKTKEATAALEVVTGKLHLLIAHYPDLRLLPVDVDVVVRTLDDFDKKNIKKSEDEVEDLVDDGRFQEARVILEQLRDDITVTVVSLPLATYPQAIEKIAPLINAGKIDEAKQALAEVLNSLVVTEEVIPFAVLRAKELLDKAFELEHKADLNNPKIQDEILELTHEAQENLSIARLLEYGQKKDYKLVYKAIGALEDSIESKQHGGTLWDRVREEMKTFKQKLGRYQHNK